MFVQPRFSKPHHRGPTPPLNPKSHITSRDSEVCETLLGAATSWVAACTAADTGASNSTPEPPDVATTTTVFTYVEACGEDGGNLSYDLVVEVRVCSNSSQSTTGSTSRGRCPVMQATGLRLR